MTEEDDEIPPLEDMTETIERFSLRSEVSKAQQPKQKQPQFLEVSKNETNVKQETVQKMLGVKTDVSKQHNNQQTNKVEKPKARSTNDNFCGFQKGFLSSTKKNTNKPDPRSPGESNGTQIEYDVTKSENTSEDDPKVFSEVQEAMKIQFPLLQSKEWVTEDLLTKILKHPKLSKQFMDPRFSQAIEKFQRNPEEVMEMCKTNAELKEFIQEFCALMGDHFTGLAHLKDKVKDEDKSEILAKTTANSSNDDEEKMKTILSSPSIQLALQSPKIQKLFAALKTDPDKAQRLLQEADGEFRHHIQQLIDVGLLQVAK